MTIYDAAAEVARFLDKQGVPYAVLGGVAVQHWGEPRTTRDVDVVVMVPSQKMDDFLNAAVRRFRPRLPDALTFARRNHILLISTEDDIPVDISLGIPGYEEEVIRRAVPVSFSGLPSIRLLSAEDLLIHKSVAGRPRDVEDVERILVRQRLKVDLRYIRNWVRALAPAVEDHDVRDLFENALKKARAAVPKAARR